MKIDFIDVTYAKITPKNLIEIDEFNELGIDPTPIAECMCKVFEKEFDSWDETGSTVWEDEWAINNEMLALEAAGHEALPFGGPYGFKDQEVSSSKAAQLTAAKYLNFRKKKFFC